jgi:broad specificity phosphatase PhoE
MIYLIRHGQTEMNSVGRFQGRLDSPLTALGEAQARRVGAQLALLAAELGGDWAIDASPLGRTRRTAELIAAEMGLPVRRHDERLAEVDFGPWEGLTRDEIVALRPDLADAKAFFLRCPEGETFEHLTVRVRSWMDEADAAGEHRVAITHAGVGRTMRGLCLGLTLDEIRVLDTPQDVIFRLAGGQVDRFECAALPSAAAAR